TPTTLYAATNFGAGVFKSSDGGGSWSAVNTGLPTFNYSYVSALAIDPQTPATLYAETEGGVFKSTNTGGSWNAVNTGLTATPVGALAIDPQTPATLYAGTRALPPGRRGGVFKSTNGGASWSAVNIGADVLAMAIDPQTPTTLYAGTGDGILKSIN